MRPHYEVLIIGAGPYGSLLANKLATDGVRVLVLEEHQHVGLPDHCAGLISIRTLEKIAPSTSPVLAKIRGARIYPPSNCTPIVVMAPRPTAVVVDRPLLDSALASAAESSGATIMPACPASDLKILKHCVSVTTPRGEFLANLAVLATGACRLLPLRAGFTKPQGVIPALQADVTGLDIEGDMVELYLSNKLFKGLFAWAVPRGDNVTRIGVVGKHPRAKLRLILKRIKQRSARRPHVLAYYGGAVITGGALRKLHSNRTLVVGDAAGQTKPTTGGGLAFAKDTTDIAHDVIKGALERQQGLADYTREWWRRFGKEILWMAFLRSFLNTLSDEALDAMFALVKEAGFEELALSWGDMDRQAGFILRASLASIGAAIKHPDLAVSLVLSIARAFFQL